MRAACERGDRSARGIGMRIGTIPGLRRGCHAGWWWLWGWWWRGWWWRGWCWRGLHHHSRRHSLPQGAEVVAPGEDAFGGASCDLVGVGGLLCGGDELEGEDGVVGGESELELGSLFVEFADGGDGLSDVGSLGPGGELAEAHFVIAADRGDCVIGGEPEEEELVVVGSYWRESGGAHAASLACVWMEASGKWVGRDLCARMRYGEGRKARGGKAKSGK